MQVKARGKIDKVIAFACKLCYNLEVEKEFNLFEIKPYSELEVRQLNPLSLAFVGDSLFSFYIKSHLLNLKEKVNVLTKKTSALVNAKAQAELFFKIKDDLTENEQAVAHRARNTNLHTHAKNFSIEEYRYATALEALIGYWYLLGEEQKIIDVMSKVEVK